MTQNEYEVALKEFPPKSEKAFDDRYISEWAFIHQDIIREALQKAAAYDAIADDLKELSGIDYAVTDAVLVFERLKHNKPDNHIYHLLHENCKKCANIIPRIKEKMEGV